MRANRHCFGVTSLELGGNIWKKPKEQSVNFTCVLGGRVWSDLLKMGCVLCCLPA